VRGKAQLHYWDSNIFIIVIIGNEPDGGNILRAILKDIDEGRLKIATSAFTLAEVIKPRRSSEKLSQDDEAKVKNVFKITPINLFELSRHIAERAREIQWASNIKPPDAIHLATAEFAKVDRFDTYDDKLIAAAKAIPVEFWQHQFEIGHPEPINYDLGL
jgi:predicted nucleic acid-binding protein